VNPVLKYPLVLLWFAALTVAFWQSMGIVQKFDQRRQFRVDTPAMVEISPNLLKVLFLGQKGIYDDFLHLWSMQLFTEEKTKSANPDEVNHTVQLILKHAPKIESFYLMSCFFI
jgi:hypothetical protein